MKKNTLKNAANTIRNIAGGSVLAAKLLSPLDAAAQEYNPVLNNPLNDLKEKNIIQAYKTIDSLANVNPNSTFFLNLPETRRLENFLGAENGLYNGTSAGIQTDPENGTGSIKYFDNELWVQAVQIGSGYGKRKDGKFEAEARASRDLSYTYALYARKAGYNNTNPEKSDDMLKKIILINNGISPKDVQIVRDANGDVYDILYTGSEPRNHDVSKTHQPLNGTKTTVNHILMVPGETFWFPLSDALEIAGVDLYRKPEIIKVPVPVKAEPDTIVKEVIKERVDTVPAPQNLPEKDSIEYRMGLMGYTTEKSIPGIGVFAQIGKSRWDGELSLSIMRLNGEYNKFTQEEKPHETLPYKGVSNLLEKGVFATKLYEVDAILSRHIGRNGNILLRGGASGDITTEKYNGTETFKTWFEGPNNMILDYDEMSNDIAIDNRTLDKADIRINPVIGVGLELGRIRITGDYHIPIKDAFNSKYAGPVNPGQFKFGFGLDFGKGKFDKKYRSQAVNTDNNRYGYYNRGQR